MAEPIPEICSIRIVFPVTSDENAIEVKKKIKAIFPDNASVHIQFEIMSSPSIMPRPKG